MYAIIDADSIAFAITASMDRQMQDDPDKDYGEADLIDAVSNFLQNIEEDTECDDYCMWLTGKHSFRKVLTETYKANRKDIYRPPMLGQARDVMVSHFGALFAQEGFEADDEVGQVAQDYWDLGDEDECIICSIDKDLDTIPGWHYRWATHNRPAKVYFVCEEDARHFYWTQVLAGDPGDGIKGIPGIGPKKARAMLVSCDSEQDYYKACKESYFVMLLGKMSEDEIDHYLHVTMELLRIGKEGRDHVYGFDGSA